MKHLFALLFICTVQVFPAQTNNKEFQFYALYEDYLTGNAMQPGIAGEIKEISDQYIHFSDYRYIDNNKKAKAAASAWALSDGKNLYFNMMNAGVIYRNNVFAKFDFINDRYMVVLLDETKESKAIGYNNPYGGGLLGAALNIKPKSTWKDTEGNSYKILLVDKKNPYPLKGNMAHRMIVPIVDTGKILELSNNEPAIMEKLKKNSFLTEDFIELISR